MSLLGFLQMQFFKISVIFKLNIFGLLVILVTLGLLIYHELKVIFK